MVLFVQTWYLGYLIVEGDLDIFLLRPLNVLFQFLFMDFNLVGLTDLIPGTIIFIYGCNQLNFSWSWLSFPLLLLVIIGGALIRGSVWIVLGSISFWRKNRGSFVVLTMQLYDKTTMYPLSIYPKALQMIFTVVLPLGWIAFYPAGYFLSKPSPFYFPASIPLITFGIGIICFLGACLMFWLGLKRYESAGT